MVYVPENCVPAAILPTNHCLELFACCANTLELHGGSCRVEGITLLPPGRIFLGLALLAFGIDPSTGISLSEYANDSEEDEEAHENIVEAAWDWICEGAEIYLEHSYRWRIIEALRFNAECKLSETLDCQSGKIKDLCDVFDSVDGYPMTPWKN